MLPSRPQEAPGLWPVPDRLCLQDMDTRLVSATNWTPNIYYRDVLPAAHWEKSHSL